MPELPDVVVYIEALEARIAGARLERGRRATPRDPHAQARADRPGDLHRPRPRLLRRDPAPRAALAREAEPPALGRGGRAALRGDAGDADGLVRTDPVAGGRRLPGGRHGVPRGHGRARALRTAVSGVRVARAADRLRRQRDQLLRGLPDRRSAPGRPRAVTPPQAGLAADARGARRAPSGWTAPRPRAPPLGGRGGPPPLVDFH